jgi:hypothetical protein
VSKHNKGCRRQKRLSPGAFFSFICKLSCQGYGFPISPFLRKRGNALHQREHFLRTRLARRRNHSREEYDNNKPRNRSSPERLHISTAPIRFPRVRYGYSLGPQQGEGYDVLRIHRRRFVPLASSPTCDERDRNRTKTQQNQRDREEFLDPGFFQIEITSPRGTEPEPPPNIRCGSAGSLCRESWMPPASAAPAPCRRQS